MKHRRQKRTLGRQPHARLSLMRGLASDLLQHGSIVTTAAKSQELKSYLSPLLNLNVDKEVTLHQRRMALSKLSKSSDFLTLSANLGKTIRLTKVVSRRHDAAPQVKVEII